MAYLIFLLAAGVFALLGSAGPLHRDGWFEALNRRLNALALEQWISTALSMLVPLVAVFLVHAILSMFLGALADFLIGIAVLYFAFGRGDFPTDLERFLARAREGDEAGACALLGDTSEQVHGDTSFAALHAFTYPGYERWFPPVFYFMTLGPFGAGLYRLARLSCLHYPETAGQVVRVLDWLPARFLLLTFALLGDFDRSRALFVDEAIDVTVDDRTLLALGIERAWRLDGSSDASEHSLAEVGEAMHKALQRSAVVWLIVLSLAALF